MKNSVVLLLMILLPLQTAWGVAALFCQHESSSTRWHWGHHEHQVDAACQSDITKSSEQGDQKAIEQSSQQLIKSAESPQNSATDTISLQHDANSKKSDQSHAFQIANHSDHLQVNPLGLNPPQLQALLPESDNFLAEYLNNNLSLFYQTPYLEQPKPPLWPG